MRQGTVMGSIMGAGGLGSVDPMKRLGYIALHAAAAGAFMFLLQRYVLSASLDTSLLWALAFGGGAAALAYSQSNR
jgi:hypothetical protein